MKQFHLLRIACLVASFALSIASATATAPWHIIGNLAATAVLALGLLYELYTRYTMGEEQKVRVTCRELLSVGIVYFVGYAAINWLFGTFSVFNDLYIAAAALNSTVFFLYLYYLWKIYLESRKNKIQEKQ